MNLRLQFKPRRGSGSGSFLFISASMQLHTQTESQHVVFAGVSCYLTPPSLSHISTVLLPPATARQGGDIFKLSFPSGEAGQNLVCTNTHPDLCFCFELGVAADVE